MHMQSRKDQDSADLDTIRVSRTPATVITATREVQTNEEATCTELTLTEIRPFQFTLALR